MATSPASEKDTAVAIVSVLGQSRWDAVILAKGYLDSLRGVSDDVVARTMYDAGLKPLKNNLVIASNFKKSGFLNLIKDRKTGSAENPVTKLFPGRVTEERFEELVDDLCKKTPGLSYEDDRDSGSLKDYSLIDGKLELPINVKNAGTMFRNAKKIVNIEPDDCLPIPAYKAYSALDAIPNLVYVVCVDYDLVPTLDDKLPTLFTKQEGIVWEVLNAKAGRLVRDAEDRFVNEVVRKHWKSLKKVAGDEPFYVISAKKAIQILHDKPRRTPGVGMRGWGTGANAEVNVHICISEDTVLWEEVSRRIARFGLTDIIGAVNRTQTKQVPSPDI